MTRYELLVFLHVLSAIVWVGGVLVSLVLWETAARAKDHATLGRLIEYDDRLGPVFWSPVVLLVLASGSRSSPTACGGSPTAGSCSASRSSSARS